MLFGTFYFCFTFVLQLKSPPLMTECGIEVADHQTVVTSPFEVSLGFPCSQPDTELIIIPKMPPDMGTTVRHATSLLYAMGGKSNQETTSLPLCSVRTSWMAWNVKEFKSDSL